MSELAQPEPESTTETAKTVEETGVETPVQPPPPLPPPPSSPPPRVRRRPRKKWGCLTIFLVASVMVAMGAVVAVLVTLGVAVASIHPMQTHADGSISKKVLHEARSTDDRIAVVDIRGVIMGTDTTGGTSSGFIKSILADIRRDDQVKAIILNLDTPGGEVLASDEIYHAVANVDIPVVACMRSVCASGGYYIAAAADYIVANEVTLTGSIGVIIPRYQYSSMLDKIGVEASAIRSGKMKDMLSGGRERTPQEEATIDAYVQSLVDETFRRFCIVVAEGRDEFLTWEDVRESAFGDGRILLGGQARELGLVDECGYFEQAVGAAQRLAGIADADLVRYQKSFTLSELFFSQAKSRVTIETGLEQVLPALKPTQMYYLMPNLAE